MAEFSKDPDPCNAKMHNSGWRSPTIPKNSCSKSQSHRLVIQHWNKPELMEQMGRDLRHEKKSLVLRKTRTQRAKRKTLWKDNSLPEVQNRLNVVLNGLRHKYRSQES